MSNNPLSPYGIKPQNDVDSQIYVEERHNDAVVIDLLMHPLGTLVALASAAVVDATSVTLQAGHGASVTVGDVLEFRYQTVVQQAIVLSIATDVISLDRRMDFAFPTSTIVRTASPSLAVSGSLATPVIFRMGPNGMSSDYYWDITRMIFQITDSTVMDDGKFGGLSALTNGLVVRYLDQNDVWHTVFNAKTNGQMALEAFDAVYATNAPAGQYGLRVRRSFNGPDKNATVIRLYENCILCVYIQDDLTGLDDFRCVIQGHVGS